MPCCTGQIQRAHLHHLLISYHYQWKSLQFLRWEFHAPCKRNLGANLFWFASHVSQWPSYDPLDVRCHQDRSPGEHLAWPFGKGIPYPKTQMVRPCRSSIWLAAQKSPWTEYCKRWWPGRPKETYTEVIGMDCLALGINETFLSDRKSSNNIFRSDVRLDPPLY